MSTKQIAIFLDGDWSISGKSWSSLRLLYELSRESSLECYYDGGSGSPFAEIPWDDPFGRDARRAYEYLRDVYVPHAQIFLFGFSAGALTALRLARLIAQAGVLRSSEHLRLSAFEELHAGRERSEAELLEFRQAYSVDPRVRFLGLLDPAGPLSLPWLSRRENHWWIHDGRLNPVIDHAFSALALDEVEDQHEPIRWRVAWPGTHSVSQVWFRGTHRDLGMSPGLQPSLAVFPLRRLLAEARSRGLALPEDAQSRLDRELRIPKEWQLPPETTDGARRSLLHPQRRQVASEEEIDPSVFDPIVTRALGVSDFLPSTKVSRPTALARGLPSEPLYRVNQPPSFRGAHPSDSLLAALEMTSRFGGAPMALFISAPEHPTRYLLARFLQEARSESAKIAFKRVTRLQPHVPTTVQIKIGRWNAQWMPTRPSVLFPDHLLPPSDSGHALKIILTGPGLPGPLQRDVRLPPRADTKIVKFDIGPLPDHGDISLRVTVLHHNRVLQSAALRAPMDGSQASLTVDASILPDFSGLSARAAADVSFLVEGSTKADRGGVLVVKGDLAREVSTRTDDATIQEMIQQLREVARDSHSNSLPLTHPEKLLRLRNLAVLGDRVFAFIRDILSDDAAAARMPESLQVIAGHPSDLHLLELVYDYPAPGADRNDITVCPHWSAGTQPAQGPASGCYAECALTAQGAHVCPNGFWGVKKQIERHAFRRGIDEVDALALRSQRKHLDLQRSTAVVGVSAIVHEESPTAAVDMISALKTVLCARGAHKVDSWDHLRKLVAEHGPEVVVLLPHVQHHGTWAGLVPPAPGVFLEIETGLRRSSEISRKHLVRDDVAPLVMLLGCEAAVQYSKFDDCLTDFRRAGAAMIVAPIATVAPQNVTSFVTEFITALKNGGQGDLGYVGAAMRDTRRRELARGNLLALGIMSFGDGDWQISV